MRRYSSVVVDLEIAVEFPRVLHIEGVAIARQEAPRALIVPPRAQMVVEAMGDTGTIQSTTAT